MTAASKDQEISDNPFDASSKFFPFHPKNNGQEPTIGDALRDKPKVVEKTDTKTKRLSESAENSTRKSKVPLFSSAPSLILNPVNGADTAFSVFDSAEKLLSPCKPSFCNKITFEPSFIKIALKLLESPLKVTEMFKTIADGIIDILLRKRDKVFQFPSALLLILEPLRKMRDKLIDFELPDTRLMPLIRPGSIIHAWSRALKNIFQLPLRHLFKLIGINCDDADTKELIKAATRIMNMLLRVIRILQYVIEGKRPSAIYQPSRLLLSGQPLMTIVKELAEIFEVLQINTGLKNLVLWLGMTVKDDGKIIYPPTFTGPHAHNLPDIKDDDFNLIRILQSLLFDDGLDRIKFSGTTPTSQLPSIQKQDDHMAVIPSGVIFSPNSPSESSSIPLPPFIFPELNPESMIKPSPGMILPGPPNTLWPFPTKLSDTISKPSPTLNPDLITPPPGTLGIPRPPSITYPGTIPASLGVSQSLPSPNSELPPGPLGIPKPLSVTLPEIYFGSPPRLNPDILSPPQGLAGIPGPSSNKVPIVLPKTFAPEPIISFPGTVFQFYKLNITHKYILGSRGTPLPPSIKLQDNPNLKSLPGAKSGLLFPPSAPLSIPFQPSPQFQEINSGTPPLPNPGLIIPPPGTPDSAWPSFIKFPNNLISGPWSSINPGPILPPTGQLDIPPPSISFPDIVSKSPPSPNQESMFLPPGLSGSPWLPSIQFPQNLFPSSSLRPSSGKTLTIVLIITFNFKFPGVSLTEPNSKSGLIFTPPGFPGIPPPLSIKSPSTEFQKPLQSPNLGNLIAGPYLNSNPVPSLIYPPLGSSENSRPSSIGSLQWPLPFPGTTFPDWSRNLSPASDISPNIIPGVLGFPSSDNDENVISWILHPIVDLLRTLNPIVPKPFNGIVNALINIHDNIFRKYPIFNVIRVMLNSLQNFSKLVAHFIKSLMTITLGNKFKLIDGIGKDALSFVNDNPIGPLSALSQNHDSHSCDCNNVNKQPLRP
ncbi:hypothetical protein FQR65_LT07293 [Abscondita terminalis]|nr:hypothetical protein FQR65_LT07293 [Abscondita terminalis]